MYIKLQVIGNLGKDAIVNNVNGKNVINFTVAHTERYKDSQGNAQEKTTWVECAYWTDKTAIAEYLVKGKTVFLEGTPEAKAYAKSDGSPAASLVLRVRDVRLLGGGNGGNGSGDKSANAAVTTPSSNPQQPAAGTTKNTVAQTNGGSTSSDPLEGLPF